MTEERTWATGAREVPEQAPDTTPTIVNVRRNA